MSVEVRTLNDPLAAAVACGAAIFELLGAACRDRGSATVAISGGKTPRKVFEWMATQSFDWRLVDLFWVDERCVPPDDEQSNYGMTRESLLETIHLAPGQVHRIHGELLPDEAALLYVEDLTRAFRLQPGELPVFDVVQRGMGPEGHTASLFPGEPLLANRTGIAAAVWIEKFRQHRVTLLPGVLERARHTLCLAAGSDKADALYRVLRGPSDPLQVPAQIASPQTTWYVDGPAGSRL